MEEQKENKEESTLGIVGIESYFPKLYISQSEFEQFNNVSSGKYTIGLGQNEMAFTTDREDICSISMTVLSNLLTKNDIDYKDIGWICVATETIIDHSKSISSMLMQLFKEKGNHEIEGIDVKHACYAGTFALFSAFDRITSKYWDGKYCIVIAADIAEYAEGAARCTGGCGAVALLIGKNGCIELNPLRASYKAHEYDFYKPNLNSPYPVVNGHVSNECYMKALDACFTSYKQKMNKNNDWRPIESESSPDYWVFHSPYNKLVSKTFGRVIYHDFINNPQFYYDKFSKDQETISLLKKYENIRYQDTVNARQVIKGFEKISKEYYGSYVAPSTFISKSIGNCYTASIFMGLMSLIFKCGNNLENDLMGKTIQMFSYGSGTMASLYSLKVIKSKESLKLLTKMVKNNDITKRFQQRMKMTCDTFTEITNKKQNQFHNHEPMETDFIPQSIVNKDLFYSNTFILNKMDTKKQRFYTKFEYDECNNNHSPTLNVMNEHDINKNIARFKVDDEDEVHDDDDDENIPQNIKHSRIKPISSYIANKMLQKSQILLKEATNHGLSKSGAIKIDKMLTSTVEATSKCSNS